MFEFKLAKETDGTFLYKAVSALAFTRTLYVNKAYLESKGLWAPGQVGPSSIKLAGPEF